MSVISLSKKLSLLLALSIIAATISLPAKAWVVKNNSSGSLYVFGETRNDPFGFSSFTGRLSPGETAACNAAEKACGGGGWINLCVDAFYSSKKSTNAFNVAVYGGMGVTIYDDKVKTVRNEKFIDNPDVQLGEIYRLEPRVHGACGVVYN